VQSAALQKVRNAEYGKQYLMCATVRRLQRMADSARFGREL
jgi:hypothetical protein